MTGERRQEDGDRRTETGNRRQEDGDRRTETAEGRGHGAWSMERFAYFASLRDIKGRTETGNRRLENGGRRQETGDRRMEDGDRRAWGRGHGAGRGLRTLRLCAT